VGSNVDCLLSTIIHRVQATAGLFLGDNAEGDDKDEGKE